MNDKEKDLEFLRKELEEKDRRILALEADKKLLLSINIESLKKLDKMNKFVCNSMNDVPDDIKESENYRDLNIVLLNNSVLIEHSEFILSSLITGAAK
jgi:hypothetical protein